MKTPFALIADRVWDGVSAETKSKIAVIVEDGKIRDLLSLKQLPSRWRKLEYKNCTLLPGLIDAHVHYSAAMGLPFLAAGVTTIRDIGNDLEWILNQRTKQAQDPSLGPRIVCCGQLLDGSPPIWKILGRPHSNAEELQKSIREEIAAGVDQIKLYAGLDTTMVSAGCAEARRHGKWITAHLGGVKAEDAARAGLNEIQHLTGCPEILTSSSRERHDALIDVFLKHQVSVTPTLVVWDRWGRILDPSFHFDQRRQWVHPCHLHIWDYFQWRFAEPEVRLRGSEAVAHLKRCLARMQERGVTIAMGTDTPVPHLIPGFSMHDELLMYVDAGIKPVDALRSATSVGARVLGLEGQVGRIVPGMEADLMVVSGNPLERMEDIMNIQVVLRAGQLFVPKELLKAQRRGYSQKPWDPVTTDFSSRIEMSGKKVIKK